MILIIGLLVLWLALAVLGFAIKSLLWLAVIALILMAITGVYGFMHHRDRP